MLAIWIAGRDDTVLIRGYRFEFIKKQFAQLKDHLN
jgi:hypothetical protein